MFRCWLDGVDRFGDTGALAVEDSTEELTDETVNVVGSEISLVQDPDLPLAADEGTETGDLTRRSEFLHEEW